MTRSKLVKARAAAARQRIGTHAVLTTLGKTKSRKLVDAIEAVQPLQEIRKGPLPYLVMADAQGVGYLRVETIKGGARFLINTGKKVDVVEIDNKTIRSRALKPVPETSILDSAKVLAQPLTAGVIISVRSKQYLDKILNDKELNAMANATKKAAATKSNKKAAKVTTAAALKIITFKKMAKEDSLPKQAFLILKGIQSAKKIAVKEFTAKTLKSLGIDSSQTLASLWSFYRARLIKEGFVSVA